MVIDDGMTSESRLQALGDAEFKFLRDFVMQHAGISMGDHKRQLLQGRLQRRLRALGLNTFREYCDLLQENPEGELGEFVSAVSTNVTSFFREIHHFEYLAQEIPKWLAKNPGGRLRIWSAGCSSGEEPYSLAMVLAEVLEAHKGPADALILATDISPAVLETAKRGVYSEQRLEGVSAERRKRWFQRGAGTNDGSVKVHPRLQELVRIRPLNLLGNWPMQGKFDAILCRNVVIYFDSPTKKRLFDRFADMLVPQGRLFLGHSESMHGLCDRFDLIGRTTYVKRSG